MRAASSTRLRVLLAAAAWGGVVHSIAISQSGPVSLSAAQAQSGPGFRIETDVMLADQVEPFLQTVTLFSDGIAYDYSRSEPHRVTVFHPAQNRIVFLDQQREIQSLVNLQELQTFMEKAKAELANSSLAQALQDAQIAVIDEAEQRAIVGQRFVRYEASFQKTDSEGVAQAYTEFANASAYINSWQAPDRNPPSFARVRLNALLSQRQAIPTEITRTTMIAEGRVQVLRSRLHASWQLSQDDRSTIRKFEAMMQTFQQVEIAEYLSPGAVGPQTGSRQSVQR